MVLKVSPDATTYVVSSTGCAVGSATAVGLGRIIVIVGVGVGVASSPFSSPMNGMHAPKSTTIATPNANEREINLRFQFMLTLSAVKQRSTPHAYSPLRTTSS